MNCTKPNFNRLLLVLLVLSSLMPACKDVEKDPALLLQRTKDFFNFTEGSQWTYDVLNDSFGNIEVYTLRNKVRSIRNDVNSEILFYDLEKSPEFKINIRCEVGPTEFSDRTAFVLNENGQLTFSGNVWAQSHRFYEEMGDVIENLGKDTFNGIAYEEVWKLKTNKSPKFKELMIAKNFGLVYIEFRTGKKLALKEFKAI